jgi:RNA polymerase sigma-70 factor (ECF subfamily)
MVSISDRELVKQAQNGDAAAFGELVRRYQASIFNVCYRMTGERREAEDMAQEAFIRAYQRLSLFDLERPFGPWMRRVAVNVCLNTLQKQVVGLALDDEVDIFRRDHSTRINEPEKVSEQMETAQALRSALGELPLHYRAVIELRHFQELSYAEFAEQLRIPLSDVKSHLFRARRLLAEKLRLYA